MRVLVDTSVWIDFFHGTQTAKVALLESLSTQREFWVSVSLTLDEGWGTGKDAYATLKLLSLVFYDGLLEIEAVELMIRAFEMHQVFVRSSLHDPPLLQNHNLVRVMNCG